MMSKRKGRNAFYYFMCDWKKSAENNGQHFPNGLNDVQQSPQCSMKWQSLTESEKNYYKSLAKKNKCVPTEGKSKLSSYGESLEELEQERLRKQQFQDNMVQYIETTVNNGFRNDNLPDLKFHFIHVNWFFVKELGLNGPDYFPAEFAIAEFSLKNGIQNIYHELISAKIPLGYLREARDTSEQTHKIPPELPNGQSDFTVIYDNIMKQLEPKIINNKIPPLFCTKALQPAVLSFLRKVVPDADNNADQFLVYSIELLFAIIYNGISMKTSRGIPLVVAQNEFLKEKYFYEVGLSCEFHSILDAASHYCSLSIVRSWGYTMCDYCCELFSINMIPGVHMPKKVNFGNDPLNKNFDSLSVNNYTIEQTQKEKHQYKPSKSVQAIVYDQNNPMLSTSTSESYNIQRPLRCPKTKPAAISKASHADFDLSKEYFPIIGGRGRFLLKRDT